MHQTPAKKIYTGIAVALAVFLAMAIVAVWQVAQHPEARLLGCVAVCGSLAYSILLGGALKVMQRGSRRGHDSAKGLREAEELNARMIESSTDCIALLDVEGRLKMVNSVMWKWIEDIGLQPVEDMPWLETWAGEPRSAAESVLASAMAGRVGRFQGLCYVRSGEGRWFDVVITPVSDSEDRPEKLLVVARDVTASHSSDEKFRVLFENATNAHLIFDATTVLACNHAAVEMLGFTRDSELIGLDVAALSPEQQPDGMLSEIRRTEIWQLVREMGHYRFDWCARRWTGEEFPVEIMLTPVWADGREVLLAAWTDLTERRLSESRLRESEQRFEAFMEHSPTLCFIKDDQGKMLFINRVMARAFCTTTEDMVGKDDSAWLPPEQARSVRESDAGILESGRASKQVVVISTAEGQTHEWLVVKFPIVSPDGRKFLGGVGMDVREQRQTERALKLSESTFRELFHDAPVAYHELDTDGRVRLVNKTELAMVGYAAEEMVGRHVGDFMVAADIGDQIALRLSDSTDNGEPYQSEFRRKDGSVIPVLVRDSLIRDSTGGVCGLRSTMQDISELKHTEVSLRAAEENYRKIFENAIEGIFQISPEGHFLNANPALAAILGYASPAELLAAVDDIGSQIYTQPARWAEFRTAMARNASVAEFECEMHCRDGSVIWVSQHARPVTDPEGKVIYYEGALENVTARREAEAAMSCARDSAVESARLKTEFLANMSHEIRTPMNGIIGMTGLLLDTELTVRQRDFAETIVDSSEALLKIINDILDFSKIEAGMLTFEEIDFDVHDVAEGVVDLFAGRALSKGIELSLIIADDVPDICVGDPGRLRQVLANLVGNALKFTDDGEVRVLIRKQEDRAEGTMLHFEVMDSGIGISIDQQARLFQAFVQADGSTTRRHGGTGLGLAISRRLVSQMGGEVWIESEPGKGSRFFFTAIFRAPTLAVARRSYRFDGVRVLVAEKSGARASVLPKLIESWGATVARGEGAADAMKALSRSLVHGSPFDLVIFDVDMPCEGGKGFAQIIRDDAALGGIKLVRLVSLNTNDDGANRDATPVEGQIAKPIKPRSVHRCIADALGREAPRTKHEGTTGPVPAEPTPGISLATLRVLVAEDSVVNQKVVQFQLRKLGCKVDAVMDGEEALLAVRKKTYDVILMDCQMPRLDGWETSRRIRQMEKGRPHRTWIIAMTAHSLVGDRERCMEAGMDAYLSKPMRFGDLAATLEQTPGACAAAGVGKPATPTDVVCAEKISAFRQLEEESGQVVLGSVIDLFVERTPPMFKDVRRAVLSEDAARISRLAHTIKGSCSNFGAQRMRAACERLEDAATHADMRAAAKFVDEVESEFGLVCSALQHELEAASS